MEIHIFTRVLLSSVHSYLSICIQIQSIKLTASKLSRCGSSKSTSINLHSQSWNFITGDLKFAVNSCRKVNFIISRLTIGETETLLKLFYFIVFHRLLS